MDVFMRIILALVLLSTSPFALAQDLIIENATSTNIESTPSIDEMIKGLNLRQKIGQLFAFSFSGNKDNKFIRRMMRNLHPGALISFKRNISTLSGTYKLNHKLQKLSKKFNKLPLLLMLDQEGGRVTRIKTRPGSPSALAIGQTFNPELSYKAGELTGELIHLLGFNMNLAPVVDLSNPNEKNFIGNRSFGNDPEVVFEMGTNFSRGLWQSQVLPTYKHFPGHGGTTQDSHKKLPVKFSYLDELEKTDLLPFLKLKDQDFPSAVMVAHVAFPNIDPSELPATFSKVLVTDLLKNKYKYKGMIVTDDLEMSGAGYLGSLENRVKRSFLAGCDLLMVSGNYRHQKRAFNSIYNAVKSGEISKNRLHESLRKIITAKLRFKASKESRPFRIRGFKSKLRKILAQLKSISDRVVKTRIQLAINTNAELLKSFNLSEPLLLFSAYKSVYWNLKKALSNASLFYLRKNKNIGNYMNHHPNRTSLFYASGLGSLRKLASLPAKYKKNMVLVNTTHPGAVTSRGDYKAVIDINTRHSKSGEWLIQQLSQLPHIMRRPSGLNDDQE